MKIDMTKNYQINGTGLAMLCQLIPEEHNDEQDDILEKCVKEIK